MKSTGLFVQVMLLLLICVSAAAINKEREDEDDYYVYYEYEIYADSAGSGWALATGWIILVASLAVITEFIYLLLHFLNPSHFNNNYGAYGGLVRIAKNK